MKIQNRFFSTILAICLTVSSFIILPYEAKANSSAKNDGYVTLDGIHLNYDNTLTALDDGYFELVVKATSTHVMKETNYHAQFSEDGFYTVEKAGKYLIELWGGSGATVSPDGTTRGSGGVGGAGGHIYGIITLKEGDVLYYSLGGNGQQTNDPGTGGGANGDGGSHGGSGNTTIGGGGGYSAVYLFSPSEFDHYLNSDGELVTHTIEETDRISKYIMIAGGGGGAGAYSSDKTALPNGGAGGSIGNVSGVLSGSTYDVEGTFFAGQNGKSSGNSTSYVGRGGSNVPGAVVDSLLGFTDVEQPNDWNGTYNTQISGGAGGAGNLRGGSGGAGFCGGSGGLMASFIIPTDVGGGGGGSSFISDQLYYTLSDAEAVALVNANPSNTGGAVCITYMEEQNTDYLNDLTLRFSTSPYVRIDSAIASNSNGSADITAVRNEVENAQSEYKFVGVSAQVGETLTIRILFHPLIDFAGGNNVPLFENGWILVQTANDSHGSGKIRLGKECGYVNIPLNFTVHVQNHNTNDAGHHHKVSDLYVDNYADARSILNNTPDNTLPELTQYHFIKSIGDYTVTELDGTPLDSNGFVAPTETTKYLVTLTVTPKDTAETGVAKVGKVVTEKTFVQIALVTIEGSHLTQLNGNWVAYSKRIEYDAKAKQYILSLGFKSDTNNETEELPELPRYTFSGSDSNTADSGDGSENTEHSPSGVTSYLIKYSGYYYLQLWGGRGGDGGPSSWLSADGGKGKDGGYVSGYVYLKAGEVLHVHMGENGKNGAAGSGTLQSGNGGEGGHPSAVALMKIDPLTKEYVVDRYIMIAGGGAGGCGGYSINKVESADAYTTWESTIDPEINTLEEMTAVYQGQAGGKPSLFSKPTQAVPGKNAVANDRFGVPSEDPNNPLKETDFSEFKSSDYQNNGGGAFYLSYLQLDTAPDEKKAGSLTDYKAEIAIAKYFQVDNVEIVDNKSSTAPLFTVPESSQLLVADPVYTHYTIEGIKPTQEEYTVENQTFKKVDFTIKLYITPREGFLGGNDVMLVDVSEATITKSKLLTGIRFSQSFTNSGGEKITDGFNVMENSATDYVNVSINYDAIPEDVLTTRDKVHFVDESQPVKLSQLYTIDQTLYDQMKSNFPNDWRSDYVMLAGPIIDDGSGIASQTDSETELSPTVTTTYTLSIGVVPKTPANYAQVASEAQGVVAQKTVTIYAAHRVTFELDEHISHNSLKASDLAPPLNPETAGTDPVYIALVGEDYKVTLSIAEGNYSLPSEVTITVDDVELTAGTDYTYSKESETITIYKDALTGPIHIQATETDIQYHLHYIVQWLVDGIPSSARYTEYTVGKYAGDPIDAAADIAGALAAAEAEAALEGASVQTDLPGYTFRWDWGDGSETPLTVMPVEDWWIFGSFSPKTYELHIRYVDQNGNEVAPTHSDIYQFGDTVQVVSPTVSGYVADLAAYSATVDTALIEDAVDGVITVKVTYTGIQNEVAINLVLENGTVADTAKIAFDFGSKSVTVVSDQGLTYNVETNFGGGTVSYTVALPSITGHHTDTDLLEGTLSESGGETITVNYTANRYTLRFDGNGGQCSFTEQTVVYGMPYNFNGTEYTAFPTVIRVGSRFDGWEDSDGALVSESDIVSSDAENGTEIVLKAKWITDTFTVTLQYVYEDGSAVTGDGFDSTVHTLSFEERYSYDAPALDGYVATPANHSGIMPAQNLVLVFTYYADESMEELQIEITWGSLSFDATHGLWNPEALAYEADSFAPAQSGSNTVTVTNNSETADVTASLSYTSGVGYESIDGYFTENDSAAARKSSNMDLTSGGDSGTLYFWLTGNIPDSLPANSPTVCGNVTVTVTPK